ncbi:hypothetical protein WJX72_007382 [[Myrmecia] bisecta]|uniref:Mannosyltransferase n=1 Tax=[Myrmecia] bisecta TaxID=41462 RepID=A0AAW1QRG4_9CHLO
MNLQLYAVCIGWRLLNALLIRTAFNPDEYWQSLEVAHRLAFGYGHLTWEWAAGLRGYAHPLLFAALYKALALLHLDSAWSVANAPRLLQAPLAACADVYVYSLTRELFGAAVARWALACQVLSWFTFYCLVRTFSNSLEAILTIAALYHWRAHAGCISHQSGSRHHPGRHSSYWSGSHRKLALLLAALAVVVRPPSFLLWLFLGTHELLTTGDAACLLVHEVLPIGMIVLAVASSLDRCCYGRWLFVPWQFFKFNIVQDGSAAYGSHSWHWNFTSGFPAICATLLPFGLLGIYVSNRRQLAGLLLLSLLAYSLPAHKERRGWGRGAVVVALGAQLLPALYLSLRHQRGTISVMTYLADQARLPAPLAVAFLMPCHATPLYSHIHRNVTLSFLDCSPPGWVAAVRCLNGGRQQACHADKVAALVQEDLPASSHAELLQQQSLHGTDMRNWPTHVITFNNLGIGIVDYLARIGYHYHRSFPHADVAVDDGGTSVDVYVKRIMV